MPKLYTSDEYGPESVAVVKKLDNNRNIPDCFVNLHVEDMEQAPESKDDAEVKLSGDYFFSPLPRNVKKMGFILYCAGKRGSGKTTCACNWANNYKILCPKNDVFLISSKEYDPTIKKELGYDRIHRIPTEKFSDESDHIPEISDFENCLVIFDDFFNDTNYKRILHLMNVLAERGRQENISLILFGLV
eukprot:gb/GECG01011725.1/.p1 GENE.gb/GECG01011725.1/~~gb/GECG01011725.1/.p1  ORF type:complete len:189 (+),score=20.32 gb/GECG01011725.1/:1-567(+)